MSETITPEMLDAVADYADTTGGFHLVSSRELRQHADKRRARDEADVSDVGGLASALRTAYYGDGEVRYVRQSSDPRMWLRLAGAARDYLTPEPVAASPVAAAATVWDNVDAIPVGVTYTDSTGDEYVVEVNGIFRTDDDEPGRSQTGADFAPYTYVAGPLDGLKAFRSGVRAFDDGSFVIVSEDGAAAADEYLESGVPLKVYDGVQDHDLDVMVWEADGSDYWYVKAADLTPVRSFSVGDVEPDDRDTITLRGIGRADSTFGQAGRELTIKYGAHGPLGVEWWQVDDGRPTYGRWDYWLENYGPLVEVTPPAKREPRTFVGFPSIPADVRAVKWGMSYAVRRGNGWWAVSRPNSPVPDGDGWPAGSYPTTKVTEVIE